MRVPAPPTRLVSVPELTTDTTTDLVASVIVPVRNGKSVLPQLIAALQRQSDGTGRFEIIVGDDGSDDGGTDSLETLDERVRVTRAPASTGYAARNRAAALASAPVLAFCDADCVPDPDWLAAGLAAIKDADVVGGFVRCVAGGRQTIWTLIDVDTFVDAERAIRNGGLLTGNLFIRRDLFTQLGGFDESLPRTGDFEFSRRCHASGARIAFSRDAVVSHPTYDRAQPFLGKFWSVNRWFAWREARAGRRPFLLRWRAWIPVVQTARSRQASGKPVGLDLPRLREHGFEPGRWQSLEALPIIYLLLPYMACIGQLVGWLAGRRLSESRGQATHS
jgi:glycosyltransferase involved in cell wall biosynthesis